MDASTFKGSIVALACWRAAPAGLHQTQLAVCQVFMNRAKEGWFSGDLYENCAAFLAEEAVDVFPDPRDPQFGQLLSKLESVTSGLVADKTGGALYFLGREAMPEKLAGAITTIIGNLVFFK